MSLATPTKMSLTSARRRNLTKTMGWPMNSVTAQRMSLTTRKTMRLTTARRMSWMTSWLVNSTTAQRTRWMTSWPVNLTTAMEIHWTMAPGMCLTKMKSCCSAAASGCRRLRRNASPSRGSRARRAAPRCFPPWSQCLRSWQPRRDRRAPDKPRCRARRLPPPDRCGRRRECGRWYCRQNPAPSPLRRRARPVRP